MSIILVSPRGIYFKNVTHDHDRPSGNPQLRLRIHTEELNIRQNHANRPSLSSTYQNRERNRTSQRHEARLDTSK